MFARPLIYCYFIRETVCCEVRSLCANGKNEIRGKFDRMDLLRKSIRISRAVYRRPIWALANSYRIHRLSLFARVAQAQRRREQHIAVI